ncbi:hypothetical protein C8T65DRAFT_180108 [Cerioporus squamosus]|nr:hypothetical protein C8T65DRAFT_180108 [Cerioporus squamosus]
MTTPVERNLADGQPWLGICQRRVVIVAEGSLPGPAASNLTSLRNRPLNAWIDEHCEYTYSCTARVWMECRRCLSWGGEKRRRQQEGSVPRASLEARKTAVLPGLWCLDHRIRGRLGGRAQTPLRGITLFPQCFHQHPKGRSRSAQTCSHRRLARRPSIAEASTRPQPRLASRRAQRARRPLHPPEVEKHDTIHQGGIAWRKANKVWERSTCRSGSAARQIRVKSGRIRAVAGLLRRIRAGFRWSSAHCRPGERPMHAFGD